MEVELSGQQKVMEIPVVGEIVKGPLFERSANEKTVEEGSVAKETWLTCS